jgi:hypothetical protein
MKIVLGQRVTNHHKMKNYRRYTELTIRDRRVPDPLFLCILKKKIVSLRVMIKLNHPRFVNIFLYNLGEIDLWLLLRKGNARLRVKWSILASLSFGLGWLFCENFKPMQPLQRNNSKDHAPGDQTMAPSKPIHKVDLGRLPKTSTLLSV